MEPTALCILNISNVCSEEYKISQRIESQLGREDSFDVTAKEFERRLEGSFTIVRWDVLWTLQYFLICFK